MNSFILKKQLLQDKFFSYLTNANDKNTFSNYGWAVQELELRARDVLKISDTKAVIATNNGASSFHTAVYALNRFYKKTHRVLTQDFTFPCNSQGPATGAIIVDFDGELNIDSTYLDGMASAHIVVVTNCFGHLQDIEKIENLFSDKFIIYDNAASPYSFYKGKNILNYGTASYVSLHHTKPIGFGEGGLLIIDKEYEECARSAINFGKLDDSFNEYGSNFKMSEIAAASILQWWDQWDIDRIASLFEERYFEKRFEFRQVAGNLFSNYCIENFFANFLPFIYEKPVSVDSFKEPVAKYYKPLRGLPVSNYVYDRIICHPLVEKIDE